MAQSDTNANRIKHLDFIQVTINRLANNSFLLKGWTVTIVAALIALEAKEAERMYAIISLLPALSFWGLDAYYLRLERLFRKLFEDAARAESPIPMYSMDLRPFERKVKGFFPTFFSKTLYAFYVPIVIAISVIICTSSTFRAPK